MGRVIAVTLESGSLRMIFWLMILTTVASALPTYDREDPFEMTVIHINDFHAHFQEMSVTTSRCRAVNSADCFGGVARVHQRQKEIREEDPEAIFLNAGDFYQGTAWYTKLKYGPMVEFGNLLNYTAMGVGNHDFDDSVEGFVPFAEQVNFPLLGANINSSLSSFTENNHYNKSTVVMVKGRLVGIIGYVTRSTEYNFPLHEVAFGDEIEAVQKEAKSLREQGVEIIIALGHSGYDIDQELARSVPELDLVVGGHSHTFLYTQSPDEPLPSIEEPKGEYPTYITQESGKVVPVVQAYCYTKYLGQLKLRFDSNGDLLTPVQSEGVVLAVPELLDGSTIPSTEALEAMEKWKANLTEFQEVLGQNEVLLEERGASEESNIGDVICDAFASAHPNTRIAFDNNGGIRSSLEVGEILYDDLLYILPFENTVDLVTMKGSGIRNVLEQACFKINPDDVNDYYGSFGYQVAGLRFKVVVTADNAGDRVKNLNVKNEDGNYGDIEDETIYNVALPSFLAGGFHQNKTQRQIRSSGIFDSEILTHVPGDKTIYQAMRDWVKANSPIHQEVEGRFTVTSIDGIGEGKINGKSNSGPFVPSFLTFLLGLSIFLL